MDNSIIAVYGSPGSYKTTTALSLARCIASKGSNVVIVGTSTIKPLLPIAVPFESKFSGSLGKALSAVDFDRDVILKNIFMATDKIGILSYNIRENSNSYAVVSPDRMDDLFIQLRQQMGQPQGQGPRRLNLHQIDPGLARREYRQTARVGKAEGIPPPP